MRMDRRLGLVACLLAFGCQDARRSPAKPEPAAVEHAKPAPAPQTKIDPARPTTPTPAAKGGPCPPPGERELLAYRTARKFAEGGGSAPGRLRAEAVRARLAQVVAHGCARGAGDKKLLEELRELEPEATEPPAVLESLWLARRMRGVIVGGGSGWVGLFREDASAKEAVELAIVVSDEGTAMEQQLLVLDADAFWPRAAREPMLVVSNTHPWTASCWRNMRFRVFRPGNHPHHPIVVTEKNPLGGYWCNGSKITATDDALTIQYEDWKGQIRPAAVQRTYVTAFRYDAKVKQLRETFGFAPGDGDFVWSVFANLVEDWLKRDWALSIEATTSDAQSRLEPVHRSLRSRKLEGEFSVELHSEGADARRLTVFCSNPDSQLPCNTWPVPIDFHVRRSKGLWRVSDVHEWKKRNDRGR